MFEEDFARFYMAEMVLAVEETHRVLGAIHREYAGPASWRTVADLRSACSIKPDNFLFDKSGHIVISDFGLATGAFHPPLSFGFATDAPHLTQTSTGRTMVRTPVVPLPTRR